MRIYMTDAIQVVMKALTLCWKYRGGFLDCKTFLLRSTGW